MTTASLAFDSPPRLDTALPASKSTLIRALICAALADGTSTLTIDHRPEDVAVAIQGLRDLGFDIDDSHNSHVQITGCGGVAPVWKSDAISLGESGTAFRLFTALVCLGQGVVTVDGSERMRERPIGDLLHVLRALGARIEDTDGAPPLKIDPTGLRGGDAFFDRVESSQTATALMLVTPFTRQGIGMHFPASASFSRGYLRLTAEVMRRFRFYTHAPIQSTWACPAGGGYRAIDWTPGADAAAAVALGAILAIAGGSMNVRNADQLDGHPEWEALMTLEDFQIAARESESGLLIKVDQSIPTTSDDLVFNGSEYIDSVPVIAVCAALADFPGRITRIQNVAHLAGKETNRLIGIRKQVQALGGSIEVNDGVITISAAPEAPTEKISLATQNDHRLVFSATVAAARYPELVSVESPEAVSKSFPMFWDLLERAGMTITRS